MIRTKGLIISALVVLLIVMHEISVLSGGFADSYGRSWSLGDAAAPTVWYSVDWHLALDADQLAPWRALLWIFFVCDMIFVAGYFWSLRVLVRGSNCARWSLILLAAADVIENFMTVWLGLARCADGDCVSRLQVGLIGTVTTVKWVMAVLTAVLVVRKLWSWTGVKAVVFALWIQRFSVVAFLPLAVMSAVPGPDVLDQLPDVQRSWLDSWSGVWHGVAAGLVYFVFLLPAIFLLGRLRSEWASKRVAGAVYGWPHYNRDGKPRQQNIGLIAAVLGAVVVVGLAATWVSDGKVYLGRLVVFCGVAGIVLMVSKGLRGKAGLCPRKPRGVVAGVADRVRIAGDIVTVAALSLAGLGMVRAYAPLAATQVAGLAPTATTFPAWLALLIGLLAAFLPWLLAEPVLTMISGWVTGKFKVLRIYGKFATPGATLYEQTGAGRALRYGIRIGLLAIAGFVFTILACAPRKSSDWLGVVAASSAALAALTVMIGTVVAYSQERQPLEFFQTRRLRLRATPVLSLLLVEALIVSLVGGRADIHPVSGEHGVLPDRPTMAEAVTQWKDRPQRCGTTWGPNGEYMLRPMLILAAEGGGIRATYWTALVIDALGGVGGGCAQDSVLFSTGASGGALALALARFSVDPKTDVQAMAGHQALGGAAVSLLTSDLLANATGLRFGATAAHRLPQKQPLDRAGLMEAAWENQATNFSKPFLPPKDVALTDDARTGHLILTSTAVRNGCRALISQLDLGAGQAVRGHYPRCGSGAAGPHSYDLLSAYGVSRDTDSRGCIGNLGASTAGLLASRFPYVTSSGVVGPCRELPAAQLVDGGYADNTGLGTIVDLAPTWAAEVRNLNDATLRAGAGDLIVPITVYIENGAGGQYDPPVTGDPGAEETHISSSYTPGWFWAWLPEALVPPLTYLRVHWRYETNTPALLADTQKLMAPALCTDAQPGCAALRDHNSRQVFVVRQGKQPSVAAPLGWTLSKSSQDAMGRDLAAQQKSCQNDCQLYGNLYELSNLLQSP